MRSPAERYQAVLEQARLGADRRGVFRPHVSLFADRVSLSGWRWRGRYRRDVRLEEISDVLVVAPDQLDLLLTSGERLSLAVPAADHWRQSILAHRDVAVNAAVHQAER